MPNPNDLSPAETLALWVDKIRDLSATGLQYSENIYDTLEIGWFDENNLPPDLYNGHIKRINDAYQIWKGKGLAHFD